MLKSNWAIDAPGQWIFLGMEAKHLDPPFSNIQIELVSKIQSAQLARSLIIVDGVCVGKVDFAWR